MRKKINNSNYDKTQGSILRSCDVFLKAIDLTYNLDQETYVDADVDAGFFCCPHAKRRVQLKIIGDLSSKA